MADYRDFYRELRTDWLKLRGCLFDTNTRLPALPAVLDDVRRRLDDEEKLALVYLTPASDGHAEQSCGWQEYDRLIRVVAEAVGSFRLEHLDQRDIVAQSGVRSDEIMLFAGLTNGSGSLDRLRRDLTSAAQGALDSTANGGPASPRLHSAAVVCSGDPQSRIERSIYHSLQEARDACRRADERRQSRRQTELRRILTEADVITRYQPIVELETGNIHGFEALCSAPSSEFFDSPEVLFTFAEESESLVDLERLCRRSATRRAVPLLRHNGVGAGGKLFVNCSAQSITDPELAADLAEGALGAGLDPKDLVVEVTERVAITELTPFRRALDDLRAAGLQVAIDDMGSGYSSLHRAAEIKPDYLKLDLSLIHDIHRSSIKRDLVETLLTMAEKFGARTVAEGIEVEEELATVREMGVQYGQGYFLASPAPPSEIRGVHFPRER